MSWLWQLRIVDQMIIYRLSPSSDNFRIESLCAFEQNLIGEVFNEEKVWQALWLVLIRMSQMYDSTIKQQLLVVILVGQKNPSQIVCSNNTHQI